MEETKISVHLLTDNDRMRVTVLLIGDHELTMQDLKQGLETFIATIPAPDKAPDVAAV